MVKVVYCEVVVLYMVLVLVTALAVVLRFIVIDLLLR